VIPANPNPIPNSQPVSLPSNEPSGLAQVNPNIPQSIYQPRMAPMTSAINSGVPISSVMSSMQQPQLPGVSGPHTQLMMVGHPHPQMPNMGPQHPLPAGQPMMPNQHQQPMPGQVHFGAPVHMGQYLPHSIPSQQVNPQPSAPNQVEQPQVAELISFD